MISFKKKTCLLQREGKGSHPKPRAYPQKSRPNNIVSIKIYKALWLIAKIGS